MDSHGQSHLSYMYSGIGRTVGFGGPERDSGWYLFSLWMRGIGRNLFFMTSCASSRFSTVILYKIDFRWRQAEVGPAELGACKATLFKGRRTAS